MLCNFITYLHLKYFFYYYGYCFWLVFLVFWLLLTFFTLHEVVPYSNPQWQLTEEVADSTGFAVAYIIQNVC